MHTGSHKKSRGIKRSFFLFFLCPFSNASGTYGGASAFLFVGVEMSGIRAFWILDESANFHLLWKHRANGPYFFRGGRAWGQEPFAKFGAKHPLATIIESFFWKAFWAGFLWERNAREGGGIFIVLPLLLVAFGMAWGSWMPGIACLSGFFWPETRDRRERERPQKDNNGIILLRTYSQKSSTLQHLFSQTYLFVADKTEKGGVCVLHACKDARNLFFCFSWLYGNALYVLLNRFCMHRFGFLLFLGKRCPFPLPSQNPWQF